MPFFQGSQKVHMNSGPSTNFNVVSGNKVSNPFFEGAQHITIDNGTFNVVNSNNNVVVNVYSQDPQGVKVTIRRLYPQLERLLGDRVLKGNLEAQALTDPQTSLVKDLHSALYTYVSNKMPIRLLQIPEMKLLERHAVAQHIARKMSAIDDELLTQMINAVEDMGTERTPDILKKERSMEDKEKEEEDAREDPWGAVCQFLFSKYAGYTILSHTWLQGDELEIIHRDTLAENWWISVPRGAGYNKLAGFVDVAGRNGATLVWADTLCINKDSSAELDESIRSMYRWYHDASLCIVYLRDTSSLDTMKADTWFTRGWTLQELLAPGQIKFYTIDWKPILPNSSNDKANPEIHSIIHKVTAINPQELTSFNPVTGSSVATRMTWAANRVTTRGEDRAYSLMGVFGVNFPISYGEGSARAFFRLVETILTTRPTSHIIQTLAWAGTAIPETIHTSRLIPSAPECYGKDIERYSEQDKETMAKMFSSTPEPIVLTHLGLRVRFLLLHSEFSRLVDYPSQKFGPFYAQLEVVPSVKSSFEKVVVLLQKRFLRRPRDISAIYDSPSESGSGVHSVVFAIYTFQEDDKTGTVQVPCCAQAFILAIRKENPPDSSSIHDIHAIHFNPTSKIGTREIVRLHHFKSHSAEGTDPTRTSNSPNVPVASILKSRLHAFDMKLLYLYL